MSQSPFGVQLTDLGLPPLMDAASLAARALEWNRRRIRALSRRTILLWVLDIVLVPALWMPFAAKIRMETDALTSATTTEQLSKTVKDILSQLPMVSGWILLIMTIVALLAAISTVRLVFVSRRLTMEQLALGLAQISEQLKILEAKK
jgi:small-conductance mechanosensitive channel